MPQVSVVIPLYNKAKYIGRALDSVLAQTFGDFEVVVVDDGSTDEGPEIVKSCADPRIRLIRQENAGPGAARNRGVRETTAPYLAFLDADDEWVSGLLATSVESLQRHPECSLSVTSRYVGPLRKDVTHILRRQGCLTGDWSLNNRYGLRGLKKGRALFCMGAFVCRRDAFERLGGFYDRMPTVCGEDTYLWLQFILNCRFYIILRPLVWIHNEASDLSPRWRAAGFLQPYLSDPGLIRENCPRQYRSVLEQYLTLAAFRRAGDLIQNQDIALATSLCDVFPMMSHSIWRYTWFRIAVRVPRLYRLFRRGNSAIGKHAASVRQRMLFLRCLR